MKSYLILFCVIISFQSYGQLSLPNSNVDERNFYFSQYNVVKQLIDSIEIYSCKKIKKCCEFSQFIKDTKGLKKFYRNVKKINKLQGEIRYFGQMEIKKGKHFFYVYFVDTKPSKTKFLKIFEFEFDPNSKYVNKINEADLTDEEFKEIEDNYAVPPPPPPPNFPTFQLRN